MVPEPDPTDLGRRPVIAVNTKATLGLGATDAWVTPVPGPPTSGSNGCCRCWNGGPTSDLNEGLLHVRRGRLRPRYSHGCTRPCGRAAGYCPNRVQARPDTDETESCAGRRTVGLPAPLVQLLRAHRVKQDLERAAACLAVVRGWLGVHHRYRASDQPKCGLSPLEAAVAGCGC
jgi:hypothetical protein